MRLIDADALIESICQKECERHYSDCNYNCSSVVPVIDAPTIEAVPIKPLADSLAWYAMPPDPKGLSHADLAEAWEEFLRGKDWWRADDADD